MQIISGSKESYLYELAMNLPNDEVGEGDASGIYFKLNGPFFHEDLAKTVGSIVYVLGEEIHSTNCLFIDTYEDRVLFELDWQKCKSSI